MGVPKFYRWISERYPCLSEVVKEHQIPEFDNLYLDMNGIIHQCSHPNDEDVHFRITEDKIFADIFHYLEVLFRIIKPRKVFFMAVDGVAPRAKMNQQRGRRFRSAKEAEDKIKKAVEKGEVLPTEARFDSNCITPGTEFMARLHEHLKYFVNMKISTDKSWQGVSIYLSGHETPGEGEHKIMEFIRSQKAKPDHDSNTRHCLYGLDADLIMLGLTSHEVHFSLLREEVRFGGKKNQKRVSAPEETTFHLLHLSLMREYIDYEFSSLKDKIPFEYDVERIIDDWILMGFLVGNDFIPHLPHLHINHDALPLLYRTYISVLPTLGGYINENGYLNLYNFEKYLKKLSDFDREHFNEIFVDLKWFESKVGNKYLNEAAGQAAEEAKNLNKKKNKVADDAFCFSALENNGEENSEYENPEDDDDDLFETEFRQYKRTYYMSKMGVEVVSDEFLADQAKCYVQAIQWILHYYYHGVQCWSWYYPYHYAPYLSDICNFNHLKLTFDFGKPFMPFEQLLAVLPAASKDLLPLTYQNLMISSDSPIIDYYPQDFKTDLNGKQQEWEAVVLIPFIDEKRLLEAMASCNKCLTEDEKKRNRHSECIMYWYEMETDFKYFSPWPEKFQSVDRCHARYKLISLDAWHVDVTDNKITNVNKSALYFCGFPTLKHIKHKHSMKKAGVQVFQQSSRGENMILELETEENEDNQNVDIVASAVLGKSVFVNWPHLEEARVIAVSDGEMKFYLEERPGTQKLYTGNSVPPTKVIYVGDKERNVWVKEIQGISEHYHKRKGVVINETAIVLHAQLLTGRHYLLGQNGEVHLEKQWSKQVLSFVYQTVVQDITTFESGSSHYKTLGELFSPKSSVFMLGAPYYGCMGEVQESSDVLSENRIRVILSIPCEPQLLALIQNQHTFSIKYNPGYVLASRLGVNGYLVSRFTGSIFIGRGSKKNPHGEQKSNVGLNLKFNKKNEEVPGYTKRVGTEWTYSSAAELLLGEYIERFPELFSYISKHSQNDVFYEDDIWAGEDENGAEKVEEIVSWLKSHPVNTLSHSSCDLQILDADIVEKIEEEVAKCESKKPSKVRVTVKPHLLFKPLEQQHGVVPDQDAEFRLFDRVVNVRENFSVPLGLRGTIIGIKGAERDADVLLEVLFDEIFSGGLTIRCAQFKAYRLPTSALINLSHGNRMESGGLKLTAVVKPHVSEKEQIGGLNHSPRSLFVPTKVNGKQHSQGQANSPQKGFASAGNQKQKDDEHFNVWQSLQGSEKSPHAQNAHGKGVYLPQDKKPGPSNQFHKSEMAGSSPKCQSKRQDPIRKMKEDFKFQKHESQMQGVFNKRNTSDSVKQVKLLKRNDNLSEAQTEKVNPKAPDGKSNSEFENLIASLKVADEEQTQPAPQTQDSSVEHLSPQSFAMKGTQMLKEILKIDSPDSTDQHKEGVKKDIVTAQPQRRQTKQIAAHMNSPQGTGPALNTPNPEFLRAPLIPQPPAMATPASELSRICSLVGMHPPTFSFLRTPQALTACQVKLSNGLIIAGPPCHTENEAKEKAALFALQRLSSLSFPLPPPPAIFPTYAHFGAALPTRQIPPVFPPAAANMISAAPHVFAPVTWRPPIQISKPYYPGPYASNTPVVGHMPAGTHNQFVPLQVTKQRAAFHKNTEHKDPINTSNVSSDQEQRLVPEASNQDTQENASPSLASPQPAQSTLTEKASHSPVASHSKTTPGSAGKRKPRKLAVNFSGPKASE
ncbi:5'-3' exoribonuclease 1 isoform X2 [Xenopus laevis]|uniref:5'-3' exoribonuclease 1 n=1 Tax=Xenopus laevis TaxID=8355 RepID=A0A8J1KU94_XENLA|nr:5'-3' exoribonuclease 1 isoform X2 [Xenopus laevis]